MRDGFHWHITLNELDVSPRDVIEVQGGRNGWILIASRDERGQHYVAANGNESAKHIEVGDVRWWTCSETHAEPSRGTEG